MKILITGATGLIGYRLMEKLYMSGYDDIRILTRDKSKTRKTIPFPAKIYEWNPATQYIEKEALEDVDIIYHLAGESVANGLWSEKQKQKILKSRVKSSTLLMNTIQEANVIPKKIISASAIGIYGNRDDELLTEKSNTSDGFLADVCKEWENAILKNKIGNTKIHIIRIGLVLASNGGALQKMLPAFQYGVAGKLGDGEQFMSWIHVDDLINQFIFLMEKNCQETLYNGVSSEPIKNKDFTTLLGQTLGRITIFPVPKIVLKIFLGEMSSLLLSSQRIKPTHFINEGFVYQFDKINKALAQLTKHKKLSEKQFLKYQWINRNKEDVFRFFATESNLEKITPPSLNFKIIDKTKEKIQRGTIINYKLRVHGIPLRWRTRINEFIKNESFIDEQIRGPYKKWIHTHTFIDLKGGTLIKDEIIYKIPFGAVGQLLLSSFIRNDIEKIFNYRTKVVKKLLA